MLRRVFADNYKTCVNVEIKLDSINLFLGENGAGKSTMFEILRNLQALIVLGEEVEDLFSTKSLTRWQNHNLQTIEIDLQGQEKIYKYSLQIEHELSRELARIKSEKLIYGEQVLLDFREGEASLYRDDGTEGPKYPFDWNRSAVGSLPERHDNKLLTWFKHRLQRFIIVGVDPKEIASISTKETRDIEANCNNFVSWYRRVSQNQGKTFEITQVLQEVIPHFKYFEFDDFGENRRLLQARIDKHSFDFGELSDGQRVLIVLYSLMIFALDEGYTLCIDEPGNFVALPEIEPWLTMLHNASIEEEIQTVLISHHPELINFLASSSGVWFSRTDAGSTRVNSISSESDLSISELVARGWINE